MVRYFVKTKSLPIQDTPSYTYLQKIFRQLMFRADHLCSDDSDSKSLQLICQCQLCPIDFSFRYEQYSLLQKPAIQKTYLPNE